MDRVGAARARRPSPRDRPMRARLAGRDRLGHRAPGLLDRHVRVDAVQLVEVDVVGAEARAARRRSPRGRARAGRRGRSVAGRGVVDDQAALGGERPPRRAGRRSARADELLVGERAVDVGGVDQRARRARARGG